MLVGGCCVASRRCVRQALDLAVDELRPWQLALDATARVDAQAARQAIDAAVRHRLELRKAWGQAVGVDAHCVQAAKAASSLWPLRGDLLAQWVFSVQQPWRLAEAHAVEVHVLRMIVAVGEQVRGGVDRNIACVLENHGWLDLLRLLRRRGEEHEVNVLATAWLRGYLSTGSALQALGAAFTVAQLEQIGDLLCQFYGLVNVLGCDQRTALGLPALAEGIQYAVAPFAFRHHCYSAALAIGPGATCNFAGFVFGSQTKLIQLSGAFVAGVAVVQRQGSDRKLLTAVQLFDEVLLQRTYDQLYASGLGLTVELIHRGNARAVEHLDGGWILSCLLRLKVRGHEAFAQRFGNGGQLTILRQQQSDFGNRLAGQGAQLGEGGRQLQRCRVFRVLGFPVVDGRLLLLKCACAFDRAGQIQPAAHIAAGGTLQLLGRQSGDQRPDCIIVGAGLCALQQRAGEYSLIDGRQGLAIGLQGARLDHVGANLLLDRQFAQALHAWVVQCGQCCLGLIAAHRQLCGQCAGENLQSGFELIDLHLSEDLRSASCVILAGGQVGCTQAQRCSLLGCFGCGGLIKQLLDAGVRGSRQLAKAGRGRAGTGCEKGSEAEGREQPQTSDHWYVPETRAN
ncbi:hypothetical protein ALP54_06370 [Pseudomonas amygdali pv. lachrymans]|nr:hypothetical protein ALP54_06370 [Pseudomonas amygdali pv. lachrymans]